MASRKIALVYVDVPNLGDPIIYDTTRYLVEEIEQAGQKEAELAAVSIASFGFREDKVRIRENREKEKKTIRHRMIHNRFIRRWFPDLQLWDFWQKWRKTPAAVNFYRNERKKLRNASLILFCGGGIFKYRQLDFHYYIDDITRFAEKRRIPVVFNAVGIEDYDEKQLLCMLLKKAVNRKCVKFISTRDDYDALIQKYIYNPGITAKRSCDPAFWIRETYGVERAGQNTGVIGLNVIRPHIFQENLYKIEKHDLFELYSQTIRLLLSKGYAVELFSNGSMADGNFIRDLFAAYPDLEGMTGISVFLPETAPELVKRIAGYERLMAVRLHTAIIGTVLGIPNISLVWNKKQVFFGEQTGLRQNYLLKEDYSPEGICEKLLSAQPYVMDEKYKQSVYDNLTEELSFMKA